jgi:D-alanyl-D-alanine carboxypeptidase
VLGIGAIVVLRVTAHGPARPAAAIAPAAPPPPLPAPSTEACGTDGWRDAAAANDRSLNSLVWSPFGRAETGWATYAPLIGREAGTRCGPATAGFAAAYARWQAAHKLTVDGILKESDFAAMRNAMALRRPFVQQTAQGLCPAAPADTALAAAAPAESYGGKPIQLRESALTAYRRLVAAARAEGVAHGEVLKLVSGYRSPAEEAQRCSDGGCNTLTRAHCSAHRTGLAMDLYLDHPAGQDPTSTDDANRAAMARSPAYRWLVVHAGDYGFLPYPFEPWHWEWTGEPP